MNCLHNTTEMSGFSSSVEFLFQTLGQAYNGSLGTPDGHYLTFSRLTGERVYSKNDLALITAEFQRPPVKVWAIRSSILHDCPVDYTVEVLQEQSDGSKQSLFTNTFEGK